MNVAITFRTRWHRRIAVALMIGLVFLTGLVVGNKSAKSEDAKRCHSVGYSQAQYQADAKKFGQKVADFNDGFATASQECPR